MMFGLGVVAKFKGDDGTKMTLYTDSISIESERHSLDGVTAELMSGSELDSRVTLTRLALIGLGAFAFKKKKGGEKYLTVYGSDFAATAEVSRKRIREAVAFMTAINNAARRQDAYDTEIHAPVVKSSPVRANPAIDRGTASELEELANKFAEGSITLGEFQEAKRRIM